MGHSGKDQESTPLPKLLRGQSLHLAESRDIPSPLGGFFGSLRYLYQPYLNIKAQFHTVGLPLCNLEEGVVCEEGRHLPSANPKQPQ